MPVFSYLAIPKCGAKEALCAELANLEHCLAVMPADKHEVVVLVTDTPDTTAENQLQEILARLPSMQALSLTFGYEGNEFRTKLLEGITA